MSGARGRLEPDVGDLIFRQEVWNWPIRQRGAIEGRGEMMKEVF